jgi:hypothetical protein
MFAGYTQMMSESRCITIAGMFIMIDKIIYITGIRQHAEKGYMYEIHFEQKSLIISNTVQRDVIQSLKELTEYITEVSRG